MRSWFGYGWAQPVVRRRWALVATLYHWMLRHSGYRLSGAPTHWAWERAVGIR